MKYLIAIVALAFSMFAHAGLSVDSVSHAGFSKLTPEQQAEVVQAITAKVAQQGESSPGEIKAEKVDKWLNVGERIGKMMGGAAREVGVAVNEFVQTPVGILTAGLIVWHFVGNVIVHAAGAILFLTVGYSFLWFMIRRSTVYAITYDPERTTKTGQPIVLSKTRKPLDGNQQTWYMFAGALIFLASIAIMFSY